MPEFSMTIQAQAPIEDVWKLLHDPSSFPLWWAGMETIEPGQRRCLHHVADRLSGFPHGATDSMLRAPITA